MAAHYQGMDKQTKNKPNFIGKYNDSTTYNRRFLKPNAIYGRFKKDTCGQVNSFK